MNCVIPCAPLPEVSPRTRPDSAFASAASSEGLIWGQIDPALRNHGSISGGTDPALRSPPPATPKPPQSMDDDDAASSMAGESLPASPAGEGAPPSLGIGSTAVPPCSSPAVPVFEMQVCAGGLAIVSDVRDVVAGLDLLAFFDEDTVVEHVAVDGAHGFAVDERVEHDPVPRTRMRGRP